MIKKCSGQVLTKNNEQLHHPLEQPIRILSDSLIKFCNSLGSETRCSKCYNKENASITLSPVPAPSIFSSGIKDNDDAKEFEHPYQEFNRNVLHNLKEKELKRYQAMYIAARKNKALAYYFYKATDISKKSMAHIENAFRRYLNYMKSVSVENIKQYINLLQNKSLYKPLYIVRMLKSLKQVVTVSYNLDGSFPELPIVAPSNIDLDVTVVTENDILKAHRALIRMEDFENALLLQLMFVLQVYPFELRWLRFEDISVTKDNKFMLKFRNTKAARVKNIMLADKIYQEIISYQNHIKGDNSKYYTGKRTINNKKKLDGHFIFNISTDTMIGRLKTGFNNKLPWFSCTSTDVVKVLDAS